MGWLSDVLGLDLNVGGQLLSSIGSDPTRLLTGVDPASTDLWNKVLGTHNKPLTDWFGGATSDQIKKAASEGINVGPGETMYNIADAIAGVEVGGQALGAFGGTGGSAGAAGDTTMSDMSSYGIDPGLGGGMDSTYATAGDATSAIDSGSAYGGDAGIAGTAGTTAASSASGGGGINYQQLGSLAQNLYGLYTGSQSGKAASQVLGLADPFTSQRAQYQAALQELVFNRPNNPFMAKLANNMVNSPVNPYMSGLYSFMQNKGMLQGAQGNAQPDPQTNYAAGNYRFQPGAVNTPWSSKTLSSPNITNMKTVLKDLGVNSVEGLTDAQILQMFQNYVTTGNPGS